MNTKIFGVIVVVFIMAIGWYYFSQNQPKITPALPTPDIHSNVSKINAIQTNPDTGVIEYQLSAESLTQNANGDDELSDIVMYWTPTASDSYTLQANVATMSKETGDFVFGQGFVFTRHANTTQPVLILSGDSLIGNTKTKLIASQTPLTITQGDSQFTAKRMQADLNTGDYDFYDIQMQFSALTRTDKPLF